MLPSFACALDGGAETAARLRAGDPPVIARVHEGRVLLDCRTIRDDELCQIPSLTVGTAGHIDHGKTALVRALTGVDTDRLPRRRRAA